MKESSSIIRMIDEMLKSVQYLINKAKGQTTKCYDGFVVGKSEGRKWRLKINGEVRDVNLYGDAIPELNTSVKVIVPQGNMNLAYFFLTEATGGGEVGPPGPPGRTATVEIGEVKTGLPNTPASVVNSGTKNDAIFDFVIPKGDTGKTGDKGERGEQGLTGRTSTIKIGEVESVQPDEKPVVTNVGTDTDAIFNFKLPKGDKGEQGLQGRQGETGLKGERGDPGLSATIEVGKVTTLAPEEEVKITNTGTTSKAVFDFSIPRGKQGERGLQGVQGESGKAATLTIGTVDSVASGEKPSIVNSGTVNDAVLDFKLPKGEQGKQGEPGKQGIQGEQGVAGLAATIKVGKVTTLSPNEQAKITNSGTENNAIFDFQIPQGLTGAKGDQGLPGNKGEAGKSATIKVGKVTTGTPETPASVTNVGTDSEAVFDFVIPKGDKGEGGGTAKGSGSYLSLTPPAKPEDYDIWYKILRTKVLIPRQINPPIEDGSVKMPEWENYNAEQLKITGGQTSATLAGVYSVSFQPNEYYEWFDGTQDVKIVPWQILSSNIQVSTLPLGSIIKINEGTTPVEYIVVHHGVPSDLYDTSCDGTWLLRKDIKELHKWHNKNVNNYKNSALNVYQNGAFYDTYNTVAKKYIKQVKIPYVNGTGSAAVASGADGLLCHVFALSMYEMGFGKSAQLPDDGIKLDWFLPKPEPGWDTRRIANFNGAPTVWWTRTPNNSNTTQSYSIGKDGLGTPVNCSQLHGFRPAIILDNNTYVDKQNNLIDN